MNQVVSKIIDISKWQTSIDWQKVKEAGISGALIRGAYGTSKDVRFDEHSTNAINQGLDIGVYCYNVADSEAEAIAEANLILEIVKGLKLGLPIVIDIEDVVQQDNSTLKNGLIAKAFCETIENAGYYAMLYASKWWLENKIDYEIIKPYDIWLAQWTSEPTYPRPFGIWQFGTTLINGIAGKVDTNYTYKDYPAIMKANGLNGFTKDVPAPEPTPTPTPEPAYNQGDVIQLNNCELFGASTSKTVINRISGIYYIYDGKRFGNRVRITNRADRVGASPIGANVTGYIELP